ncbi:MAG: NAD(P)/FAD-dependent oxidoreductase [candidate division Zixibacteria bacterium]|nr:NAD(P)/FAD-dependent oxidoreductase [candidate division Zixibacteria bacterium]MCI0594953.1 NAD(P)/FAD-dependent oxidoreductase [candidate division Zixibacteria bacterium]
MRIAIIGGGAAGFFGAISAVIHNPSSKITLLEAAGQPLRKLKISGGGRCNVTHHCFDPTELVKGYPRGAKELLGPFTRFGPKETVEWFEKEGVRLKTEGDGRMFPITDKSETVIECLVSAAQKRGVGLRLGAKVKNITAIGAGRTEFEIEMGDGTREKFERVLLATGGSPAGHRMAAALGHSIVPTVPSLFTFNVKDPRIAGLAGISFENVRLTLSDNDGNHFEQTGPLLITHWGLSGPAVLKLSARGARVLKACNYRAALAVNFLPEYKLEGLYRELVRFKEQNGRKRVGSEKLFAIPARYWGRLVHAAGIAEELTWTNVSKKQMNAVGVELSAARFAVSGKGIFKEEFVTAGGVSLKEVDFKTMQSRVCPGLFLAGEILDIDGITGGFNFQSAWTAGWLAGANMMQIE